MPTAPRCTILADTMVDSPQSDRVMVSEAIDPSRSHGFAALRGLTVPPGLIASLGTNANVYGISEAWYQLGATPSVVRAAVAPASRPGTNDLLSSAWFIQSQDTTGTWTPPFATGSANRGNELADRDTAGLTVPQLMPAGDATRQMFACAGSRTQNAAQPTTWFVEVLPPPVPPLSNGGRVSFIQDVLNGDDYFVPNAPGPIIGPATPPSPTISGPGNPVRSGAVHCAMTQTGDDLATRELHLLALSGGRLYHSMLSNFGPVTNPTSNRFRSVSPWADVAQALGVQYNAVTSAAMVASRPSAISVVFIAQTGSTYRLWHAVRFSSGGGSWRPADEVWRLSGEAPNGSVYDYKLAAGMCPPPGATGAAAQATELIVAQWGGANRPEELLTTRMVTTPVQWTPSVNGLYSPRRSHGSMSLSSGFLQRNFRVPQIRISTRPWADNAVPAP